MNWEYIKSIALRFLRVFASAGIAQVVIILAANPFPGFDPETLKNWAVVLITAFVTGGLAAIDKSIRYKKSE